MTKVNNQNNFYRTLSIILIVVLVLITIVILMLFSNTMSDVNIKSNETMENNNNKGNIAVLETNKGIIKIELYTEKMPITTSNFIKLVNEGYYDNTKFHRVIKDFMIQGGDNLTKDNANKQFWGTGGPGYTIEDEFVEGLSNVKGTISMANSGQPNSGGSQFFINTANNTFLDFDKEPLSSKHPVFGKVIEGMNVVTEIGNINTGTRDIPTEDIIILKAYIQ